MGDKTGIEWTRGPDGAAGATWNPTTGCDRVTPGCDNCYALGQAKRLKAMGQAKYQTDGDPRTSGPGFGIAWHPDALDQPIRWTKPRRIFVNSMSDLFHAGVPDEFIAQVFAVMAVTPRHTYQVLTKRHGRMRSLLSNPKFADDVWALVWQLDGGIAWRRRHWPLPNVWLGVSVEDQKRADLRIPALLATAAAVRFLSCEPLLGPVSLKSWLTWRDGSIRLTEPESDIASIDWVIVGGESGRNARPMHPDWARQLRDQCVAAGVPFFLKQWGEWGDLAPVDSEGRFDWSGAHAVANDGTVYADGDLAYPDGPRYGEAIRAGHDRAHLTNMYRLGKHRTGRELDGRTWDEFPAQSSEVA